VVARAKGDRKTEQGLSVVAVATVDEAVALALSRPRAGKGEA
jgi:hypothetical protein